MDSQIYLGDTLVHPETNSDVVIHNDSNLKNFLNGLISTDNMPAFMQSFLMSQNYVQANQALKTIPETYFDHAFNKWTAGGTAPTVSGGSCCFDGSGYIQSTPGFNLGGDSTNTAGNSFTIQARFKILSLYDKTQVIFTAFNTAASAPFWSIYVGNSSSPAITFLWRDGSNKDYSITGANISVNTWYTVTFSYDQPNKKWRLFLNGSLQSSKDSMINLCKTFRIGQNYSTGALLYGYIDYLHVSNVVRTSNFTPQTPAFDDNTFIFLSFDQVISMDFLQYLPNLSFVEIVCLYLLFDVKKSLNKLSTAIDKLSDKVDKIDRLENEIRELKFKVDKLF